jgi:hypothetical protein
MGLGLTYARKMADSFEGYDRWAVLLDGGMTAFDAVFLYVRSAIPVGSDALNPIFDRIGIYMDTGARASYRLVVTEWLTAAAAVDLRAAYNNPPDPEDAPDELKTPSRLALTLIPEISAELFGLVTVEVRSARFRRFGVPWGTDRFEGFALSQNNGIKAAPVPLMVAIRLQI